MSPSSEIIELVRIAASKKILVLPHAIRQMARPDRMITIPEIRATVLTGTVVEDYPEDVRGHSCLVLKAIDGRSIHVVCSPKEEYLAVITAYIPETDQWDDNFQKRRSK